jgi:hypothetical protein
MTSQRRLTSAVGATSDGALCQAVLTGRWDSRRLRWRSDEFRSRHRSESITPRKRG